MQKIINQKKTIYFHFVLLLFKEFIFSNSENPFEIFGFTSNWSL